MESVLLASSHPSEAVRRVYESFFPGVSPPMIRLQERAVDWQIKDLRAHGVELDNLPPAVQESSLFHELPLTQRQGRRLTAEGLALLRIALAAQKQLQPRRAGQIVLELGAGIGEVARLLRRLEPAGPPHTQVIVDVPEALCMAGLSLGLEFPGEPLLWVDSLDALAGCDLTAWRFILVPVSLAHGLAGRKFDLFLHASALAGPQSTGVTAWGKFVQEIVSVDRLVALNRFLNTQRPGLAPWRPSEPAGALQYDAQWRIDDWEIEPSYLRCPFMTKLYPRCVQIVAQRDLTITPDQAARRAHALVEDVKDYQWLRHDDGDALENTCWDNALHHDGSTDGSLFKLWESIRLNPNLENLLLMIAQIDRIQRFEGKTIDETPLYEQMVEHLLQPCPPRQRIETTRWLAERHRGRTDITSLQRYLREVLREYQGRRIICYGVGLDFDAMIQQGIFTGQTIVGLIDDRRPPGSEIGGYTVVRVSDLPSLRPDVILATSSAAFSSAILPRERRPLAFFSGLGAECGSSLTELTTETPRAQRKECKIGRIVKGAVMFEFIDINNPSISFGVIN